VPAKKARETMTTEFRVMEASWPPERARAMLAKLRTPVVLVRRREGEALYHYVYLRDELVARLQGAGASDVTQALGLHEWQAAPAVPADAVAIPSDRWQVVVDGRGPVGLIAPPWKVTRGGTRNGGSTESPPPSGAAPAVAKGGLLTRHLAAELPASIASGSIANLMVALSASVAAGTRSAVLTGTAGTKIEVLVKAVGLTVLGMDEGELEVADPQPDLPLRFKLRADEPGAASVRVYAFSGGAAVASLTLTVSVTAAGSAGAGEEVRESMGIDLAGRELPDLSMYIFERGDELTFRLQSADGKIHMKPFGPTKLKGNPQEFFRIFFADIEKLPLDNPRQRLAAQRKLEAKGANLFDIVFPDDLKALLWEVRDRIGSVQITSDEPWIPWEVCRLKGTVGQRVEEGKFFAEAFSVTRWLAGVGAPREITLGKMAVVVPGDSGLTQAPAERTYLLSLADGKRTVEEVPATYDDLTDQMAAGKYDAWHFTGHARADRSGDADQSAIELTDRETLKPEDVIGSVENVVLPRPFVFLNACQSAQAGLSLTGIGGWARRFVGSGRQSTASAFIGCYWSVYDEAAFAFAKALYAGLFAGKPIGLAAKEARLAIRQQEDPSWLAYTVYADPHARVKLA
jgi:Ternary complex associated domain 7/CHAT domain